MLLSHEAVQLPDSEMLPKPPPAFSRKTIVVAFLFSLTTLSCFMLFEVTDFLPLVSRSSYDHTAHGLNYVLPSVPEYIPLEEQSLEMVLKNAAMEDKTVILTTLNEAWASPGSVIDLFIESFRIGDGTRRLLEHLVIIALDQKAYTRCEELHRHCFALSTEGVDFSREAHFMSPDYLKMMWRRIDFLCSILEMEYNFVFTDADVMWFRDPFPRFHRKADFQIACDQFFGNTDLKNIPNGGFSYVRSNNRSISFYKFWYASRETHPGYHDQDVLNQIKYHPFINESGLKMWFLDTAYFGGFCERGDDMNEVCTMHANCCSGLESKLYNLRIMLQDWRQFLSLPEDLKTSSAVLWRVPQNCSVQLYDTSVV